LQRILFSILETRPEDPETHIIHLLSKPGLGSVPFPSSSDSLAAAAAQTVRRHSAGPVTSAPRRRGISSKLSSSTEIKITQHPKDEATFLFLDQSLKAIDMFSFLQDDQRRALIDALFPLTYKDGEVIVNEGMPPSYFYIVHTGQCRITERLKDREPVLSLLTPGQCFGQSVLVSSSPRLKTVVAVGDVTFWAVDQVTYLGVLKEGISQKRSKYRSLLNSIPFLKVLNEEAIDLVAEALSPVNPPPGEVVIRQGEPGNDFYIIMEGECIVLKEDKIVGTLSGGQYFGELALMTDGPRRATVRTGEQSAKLLKLDRASFQRLLGPCLIFFTENAKQYQCDTA
jgi:cAMP-dependent protein kinase regulator